MNVLYLSYTGLGEPLGVSQVLGYLTRLAMTHRITLVTIEKAEHLDDAALMADRRRMCEAAGIRWVARRYHKKPRLLATAWDLSALAWTALRETRRIKADLIHARAYIPAFVAALIGAVARTPFIFDTRAFWPEEIIAAGRLKRGSLIHRAIVFGERICLRRAAGIVFLTRAAADYLRKAAPALVDGKDIVSIPTCADLDRYHLPETAISRQPLRIVSAGTLLSGWYRADLLFRWLEAVRRQYPDCEIELYSADDPARLQNAAKEHGFDMAGVVTGKLAPDQVPQALRNAHVVPLFYKTGLARLAGFPTRMAEALGSGLAVVANGDSGEVANIIADNGVGVLLDGESTEALEQAVGDMLALLSQPDLAERCRETAERLFSVDAGAQAYNDLYQRVSQDGQF